MGIGVASAFDMRQSANISGGNKSVLGEAHFWNGRSDKPSIVTMVGNGSEITQQPNISTLVEGDIVSISIDMIYMNKKKLCLSKSDVNIFYALDIDINKDWYPCIFCCSCKGNEFEFVH